MLPKISLYWGLILMICACNGTGEIPVPDPSGQEHPFLIVRSDQFASLRQKSETEPWKSMKSDAIARSNAGFSRSSSNSTNAYRLQAYIGAAALAYILDESNEQLHAERVRDAIINQYSQLELDDRGGWGGVVPNLGSFFVAILSLDIVYNALSEAEVSQCELVISNQIFTIARTGSWVDVRLGTHGTWDIYKGERTNPDDEYYNSIMHQITEDGVSPVTIHYAWERLGGGNSRISKSGYMDVLEFTGIDRRYYSNERLQKFFKWLFGSSVNTAKEMAIIGDMLPTQSLHNDMLHRRVGNFDREAAAYAAWFHEGVDAWGNILTYILPQQALPSPQIPQSQLYTNGGAFFREKPDDPNGLHAVLYNIMSQDEWHTHEEVNGLALSGYGNRLLVNGGRLGSPVRAAALNNTLTIDGNNHQARIGGGIREGFTANELDYAIGLSGPALSNDVHERSLILIHAADGANAYCVLFDEVAADVGEQVKNYLHPANETQLQMVSSIEEYMALIDHKQTLSGAKLSFFFATPPLAVNIEKVPSAVQDRYPGYPDHNRLEAVYPTDTEGDANLITILFPHDPAHPKATFARISGSDFTGGTIAQTGGITDDTFESDGKRLIEYNDITFQAKALIHRQIGGETRFYFAKDGTYFSHEGVGFESASPVSLYVRGNTGVVISPGTQLSLNGPGVSSLNFSPAASIISTDTNHIELDLPKGVYYFE